MARIAFISLNREQLPDPVVPLGMLYLLANTPYHHQKKFWDLCFVDDFASYLTQKLEEFSPNILALSIRNLQNAEYTDSTENLDYYSRVITLLRCLSSARIVLGGSGFSILPDTLMRRFRADFGLVGEGEDVFVALLDELDKGPAACFDAIGNLYYFNNDQLVFQPPKPSFLHLDGLVSPDYSLIDKRYLETHGTLNIQSKRGCPLLCSYCTYPKIEGRSKRLRAPELVADEMMEAARLSPAVRHLFIVDSTFNLPASHAKQIARELIARRFNLPWTCYINPIGFDLELAELMREAGCVGYECGSDSGSLATLKKLRKGFDPDDIAAVSVISREIGLHDCHTFVLGAMGEGRQNLQETFDFLAGVRPFCAILMVWQDDVEKQDAEQKAQRVENLEFIRQYVLNNPLGTQHWIVPELGVNYDPRLFRILRLKGLSGPLWHYIDQMQ